MRFPGNKHACILTAALLAQGAVFYTLVVRPESTPPMRPLDQFPESLSGWYSVQQAQIDKATQEVLRADDTLNRVYAHASQSRAANLFIAFFKTQRFGQTPHSPRHCLPGAGWVPTETGRLQLTVPGAGSPIAVNKYVVARGDERTVVLYWFQTAHRVVASEFAAKFWLVADSVRYNRSDTALVRIMVPVRGGDEDGAVATGIEFIEAVFQELQRQMPA